MVVGAAALWPVLILGIAFPRIATYLVAFIPLGKRVPAGVIRPVWIVLALLVPLAVGLTVRWKTKSSASWWRSALAGFRITLGLAGSFLFTLVSAPALRVWSLLHKRTDEHLVVISEAQSYEAVATGLSKAWDVKGLSIRAQPAPFWLVVPTRILTVVAGKEFDRYVPKKLAYFEGSGLQIALYPSDLLLRGPATIVARALSLAEEALIALPALQTTDPGTQQIEHHIQNLWHELEGQVSPAAKDRLSTLVRELHESESPAVDQTVVYRELLQVARAVDGLPPLLQGLTGRSQ
jgi:hypothetical protein